ncbi:MAG: hypothetical protein AAF762_02640 [Pseudomonadota bacterium]
MRLEVAGFGAVKDAIYLFEQLLGCRRLFLGLALRFFRLAGPLLLSLAVFGFALEALIFGSFPGFLLARGKGPAFFHRSFEDLERVGDRIHFSRAAGRHLDVALFLRNR